MPVVCLCCCWLLVLAAAAGPASAHHQGTEHDAPADGISIPGLTHGQMAVIARNLGAIRDLADRQAPTDAVMRRLQGFVNLQMFACAWGLVPGSVDDEASPFNECAHAYLAGAKALLLHLQQMPGAGRNAVDALVDKVQLEMLANDTALILCRYSDKPFSTGEVIAPRWRDIPSHFPSMATAAVPLVMIAVAAVLLSRFGARHRRER